MRTLPEWFKLAGPLPDDLAPGQKAIRLIFSFDGETWIEIGRFGPDNLTTIPGPEEAESA